MEHLQTSHSFNKPSSSVDQKPTAHLRTAVPSTSFVRSPEDEDHHKPGISGQFIINYKSLTWMFRPFWVGFPYNHHHLGWPTGGLVVVNCPVDLYMRNWPIKFSANGCYQKLKRWRIKFFHCCRHFGPWKIYKKFGNLTFFLLDISNFQKVVKVGHKLSEYCLKLRILRFTDPQNEGNSWIQYYPHEVWTPSEKHFHFIHQILNKCGTRSRKYLMVFWGPQDLEEDILTKSCSLSMTVALAWFSLGVDIRWVIPKLNEGIV